MKRLFKKSYMMWVIAIVFVALYLLKNILPPSFIVEVVIDSIYVIACSFLIGQMGFVSFGQPAYLAFGAFGTAFYLCYAGTNPYVGLLAGVLLGLVVNIIVGAFFTRLSSDYFCLCNLAFAVVTFFVFQKALVKYTHGDNGLWFISRIESTPILDLSKTEGVFILAFIIAILVYIFFDYLMNHSVFGATCLCAKTNPQKLQFLGYNVFNIKWSGFVIANTVTSLVGSLYALYFGFVSAAITAPAKAVDPVATALLGGVGTLFGPLVGSILMIGLKDLVSEIVKYWELLVGILLIIVMLAGEKGIVGSVKDAVSKFRDKYSNNKGLPATTSKEGE